MGMPISKEEGHAGKSTRDLAAPPTRAERRAVQTAQRARKALAAMSPSACELICVRHGETDWNGERRLQGQLASAPGLNATGRHQAEALALALRAEPLHAAYTSDLARARETADSVCAAHASLGAPHAEPALRERRLGALEGLTYVEAAARVPEAFDAVIRRGRAYGDAEAVDDLVVRVGTALEAIAAAHPGQRVLVVTHGGALHAAHVRAAQCGPPGGRTPNCAVCRCAIDPAPAGGGGAKWAVLDWADDSHLAGVGYSRAAFGGGAAG